jgi:hypothetical protein
VRPELPGVAEPSVQCVMRVVMTNKI